MTPSIFSSLVRAADAPAHEAVRLSRAPIFQTFAPAVIGLVGLSTATLIVAALRSQPTQGFDALSAVIESFLTIAPITLVLSAWGPLAPPRVVAASLALGVLTAGWVAMGLVPLAAFIALGSYKIGWALDAFGLLVATCALGSIAMVFSRVIEAFHGSTSGRMASRLFAVATFGVFVVRAQPWISRLNKGFGSW